jgi:hypothetical protein
MSLADQIRQYAFVNYVGPARQLGRGAKITIIARDIVKKLRLHGRVPAVCSALDAVKFQVDNRIHLVSRTAGIEQLLGGASPTRLIPQERAFGPGAPSAEHPKT